MLKFANLYCSNCLRTRRFLDLGEHLICEQCSKRLERVHPRDRRGRLITSISDDSHPWRRTA